MRRNVAGQSIGVQLVSKTDGTPVTSGTTTVYVTGDAGTQGAGSVGAGACTHEGNGFWTYAPAQAETNYTHVAFTFTNTSAVNATVQVWPLAYGANGQMTAVELAVDQAVNVTKVGGTTQTAGDLAAMITAVDDFVDTEVAAILAAVDTEVGAIKAKTDNLPAAPAATGDIPTAAAIADAVWDEATAGHVGAGTTGAALTADPAGVTTLLSRIASALTITAGKVDVNDKTGFTIAAGGIPVGAFAAGAITDAATAADMETAIANAVRDLVVEAQGSYTLKQALSIILAVVAGVTADGGATIKTPNGVATRVAATVNGSNERTAMVISP